MKIGRYRFHMVPQMPFFLKSFPKGTKIIHRQFYQGAFRVDAVVDADGETRPLENQQPCNLQTGEWTSGESTTVQSTNR